MDHLYIRADATPKIGIGHIMRCIAFGQAWKDRGGQVTLLSHCESDDLRRRIIDEGFDFIPIETPHPNTNDLDFTLDMLSAINYQLSTTSLWLVLDGYNFSPYYQKAIRESGYKLLVIDDMAHLDHYHADILLNQNIHASSLYYSGDRDTEKLLGCEYVLLRREFLKYKDWKREIPDKAKKILVTMGGADPDNVTLKVIKALNFINDSELDIRVVVGPTNPNKEALKNAVLHTPCFMRILENAANMTELMAWADVAVSAGGSTCWEMAFMQLPYLVIILSDNQERIAKGVGEARAALNCGWFNDLSENLLSNYIGQTIEDSITRKKYVEKGMELLDGLGVERVIDTMRNN